MTDSVIQSFDIWTTAQGLKSKVRVKSIENISLEGIAHLRELILELAVMGKLVPQDPNDEPVGEMLKKVEKEVKIFIKEGKIKKYKRLPNIEKDDCPFVLPIGWEYVRLNDVGEWGSGSTPNRSRSEYYGGKIPWFKSGELVGDYISNAEESITELALKESSLRYNKVGDVLIAMYGATIGKTSILTIPATTNQAVCACTPFQCISNIFLLTLLKAYKIRFTGMGAGGAQPNISKEKIIATVITLPPLAEQHRIVAKVEELMVLCDKLEEQQTNNLKSHQLLVKTLLETLTRASDANELQAAWERMAAHFDTLFCTEDSIDQLKQSILQLAVMGKLIPQNSDDEPASILLKKIAKEKAQLVKEGKINKQNTLPEITEEEKSFNIPIGWIWAKLQTLVFLLGDGLHGTPTYTDETNYYFINGNNLNDGKIEIKPDTKTVSKEEMLKYKKELSSNTILVSINGTLGKVAFYNGEEIMLGKSACYFNLSENVFKYYIKLVLESKYFMDYAIRNATGTTIKNLGLKAMNDLPIPLPSLPEQHRIVAKVDELFTICDALKANIMKAEEMKGQLAEAVVEGATA